MSNLYYRQRDYARNYRYTTLTNFGGIDTSDNAFEADLRTAHDALNVYVDERNVLATRPRLDYKSKIAGNVDDVTSYNKIYDVYLASTDTFYSEIEAYTTQNKLVLLTKRTAGETPAETVKEFSNPIVKAMFANNEVLYILCIDDTTKDLYTLDVVDGVMTIVPAKRTLPVTATGANFDSDTLTQLAVKNTLNNQYKVTYKAYLNDLVADKDVFENVKDFENDLLESVGEGTPLSTQSKLVGEAHNRFWLVGYPTIDNKTYAHYIVEDKDIYVRGNLLSHPHTFELLSPDKTKLYWGYTYYVDVDNTRIDSLAVAVFDISSNEKTLTFDYGSGSRHSNLEVTSSFDYYVSNDGFYYSYVVDGSTETSPKTVNLVYLSVVGDQIFEDDQSFDVPYDALPDLEPVEIWYASSGYVCLGVKIDEAPSDAFDAQFQYAFEINITSDKAFVLETALYVYTQPWFIYKSNGKYSYNGELFEVDDIIYDFKDFVEFGKVTKYAPATSVTQIINERIALNQTDDSNLNVVVDYGKPSFLTIKFPITVDTDTPSGRRFVYTNGWIYYTTGTPTVDDDDIYSGLTLHSIKIKDSFTATILYEEGEYPTLSYNSVVFVGNEFLYYTTDSNEVQMSIFNDPTYLPETTYTTVGDDTPIISCIGLSDNYYAVFKRNKTYSGEIGAFDEQGFVRYTTIVDLKTPIGCVAPRGTIVTKYSNIPVTISYDGIYGLYQQQNVLNLDHVFTPMSQAINVKWWEFVDKKDFKVANVKYWTYFYSHRDGITTMFVLDNRTKSWFYWKLPVPVLEILDEEEPIIVTTTGVIYEMTTHDIDYIDELDGQILATDYKDKVDDNTLVTIDWFWESQIVPLGTINYSKNLYTTKFMLVDNDLRYPNEYRFNFDYTVYRKTAGAYQAKTISNSFKDIVSKTMRSFIVNLDYLRLRLSNMSQDDTVEVQQYFDDNGDEQFQDLHVDDCRLNLLGIEFKYTLKESDLR